MAFDLRGVIRVEDRASQAFKSASSSAKTYRDALGRLRDEHGKFVKDSDRATASSKRFGTSLSDLKSKASSAIKKIGGITAAIGTVAVAYKAVETAKESVVKAMDFEAELSTIKALTGSTADEMKSMSVLALDMGANTKYSALEAARGIEELLKAGLTPASVQAGGLEAALNLATAGGLGLADAAEIMSTSLNAFKKDGNTAAQAANYLAGTANASATGVEDLRYSLAAVSSVAAGVGLSFEDTAIALGLFANSGLKGSDAGTSLKTMLQNLQPTTKEQIALSKKLGLMTAAGANAFYDSAGNIKSLSDISDTLRKSLGKLTNQERSLALETLFGSDAIRAANILFDEGADGVADFRKEMSKVTALDVATEKMNNTAGSVEQLKGAFETLQISALTPTLPLIRKFVDSAQQALEQASPQITAAMQRMSTNAERYLRDHFTNNPKFQQITTLSGKVGFVFDDLMGAFNSWYSEKGSTYVADISRNLTTGLARALEESAGPITSAALKIGASIASGMKDGLWNALKDHPILGGLVTAAATPGPLPAKIVAGTGALVAGNTGRVIENYKHFFETGGPFGHGELVGYSVRENSTTPASEGVDGSFAGGISRIPRNGYVAELHRDEAVLTRGEARDYRNGGGNGRNITLQINGPINIHTEADYQAFARRLINDIYAAGEGGA